MNPTYKVDWYWTGLFLFLTIVWSIEPDWLGTVYLLLCGWEARDGKHREKYR
jgi:hypothetical protein